MYSASKQHLWGQKAIRREDPALKGFRSTPNKIYLCGITKAMLAVHRRLLIKVGLMMNMGKVEIFQGNKIEILEMVLKSIDNQLELSWEIYFENEIYRITFSNVLRLRIGEVSAPLDIHGFEIINHSQNGWEKDSTYEIRDFEDNRVNFFCECFKLEE